MDGNLRTVGGKLSAISSENALSFIEQEGSQDIISEMQRVVVLFGLHCPRLHGLGSWPWCLAEIVSKRSWFRSGEQDRGLCIVHSGREFQEDRRCDIEG